jgi:hypothetical protein
VPDLVLKLDASDYATCAAKKEDARVMGAIRFHERNRLRTALMLTNIPISPARAAAGSATLDENAAPEPRPTQETPASAASLVQPAAAAAAGPVLSASQGSAGGQNGGDGGDGQLASEILDASLGFDNNRDRSYRPTSGGSDPPDLPMEASGGSNTENFFTF